MYRYPPGRNATADGNMPVVPVPYELGGMFPREAAAMGQPMPITALSSALANAPPEQQRTVCCSYVFKINLFYL